MNKVYLIFSEAQGCDDYPTVIGYKYSEEEANEHVKFLTEKFVVAKEITDFYMDTCSPHIGQPTLRLLPRPSNAELNTAEANRNQMMARFDMLHVKVDLPLPKKFDELREQLAKVDAKNDEIRSKYHEELAKHFLDRNKIALDATVQKYGHLVDELMIFGYGGYPRPREDMFGGGAGFYVQPVNLIS